MLLILSRKDDEHVRYLLPHLQARKAKHRWIDPGDFPGRATISLRFGVESASEQPLRQIRFDNGNVDLDEVTAVWYRYPSDPTTEAAVTDPLHRRAAASVSRTVLLGLADTLDAFWLPGRPRVVARAQNKIGQLSVAPQLGFTVPRALITNDPDDVLTFWEQCEGRMIVKLVSRIDPSNAPPGWNGMPTYVFRRRDLANFRGIRYAPMILQEYVPKRLELRVTVVGDRIFACQIDSQASRATRHDWRHYDTDRAALAAHDLPDDVGALCVRIVEAYGLVYGAVDLVLTPAGDYVFLELNPMGEWVFVQVETGMPIAEAIVDSLTAPHVVAV
jgi:glutathione synthase/RimK-type ligase-like ATP-grasp enzyme